MPWRVALALQAEGWYLRSDIIWHKPNPKPEGGIRNRPTKGHEYLFLLAKQEKYFYDIDKLRKPVTSKGGGASFGKQLLSSDGTGAQSRKLKSAAERCHPLGKNKRSVWTIPVKSFSGAHFAVFPTALVRPCILAGSRPGGTVLDCFAGSGTTGVVAKELGRDAVLIDLNPVNVEMQKQRAAARKLLAPPPVLPAKDSQVLPSPAPPHRRPHDQAGIGAIFEAFPLYCALPAFVSLSLPCLRDEESERALSHRSCYAESEAMYVHNHAKKGRSTKKFGVPNARLVRSMPVSESRSGSIPSRPTKVLDVIAALRSPSVGTRTQTPANGRTRRHTGRWICLPSCWHSKKRLSFAASTPLPGRRSTAKTCRIFTPKRMARVRRPVRDRFCPLSPPALLAGGSLVWVQQVGLERGVLL